jgi:hypothetical protein
MTVSNNIFITTDGWTVQVNDYNNSETFIKNNLLRSEDKVTSGTSYQYKIFDRGYSDGSDYIKCASRFTSAQCSHPGTLGVKVSKTCNARGFWGNCTNYTTPLLSVTMKSKMSNGNQTGIQLL